MPHCSPQKIKSMFFEILLTEVAHLQKDEKISNNIEISLKVNHSTTRTHIICCSIFPFFAHCATFLLYESFVPFFTDLLDLWTQKASGCTCPDDVLDNSCPCCVSNGCQCSGLKSQRCGQCGLEQYCDQSKYNFKVGSVLKTN